MIRTVRYIFVFLVAVIFLVTCSNQKIDNNKNEHFVATFIKSLRTVTLNTEGQRKMVLFVLFSLNEKSNAFDNVMDYYEEYDPFERNKTEEVKINITHIKQRDLKSYMIKWKEERFNHIYLKGDSKSFEGILDIETKSDLNNNMLNNDDFSNLFVNNIRIKEIADADNSI